MEHRCTFWSPHFMSLLFLCCLLSGSNCGIIRPIPGLPMVTYSRPGNLTLGIVTSVHKSSETNLCGNEVYNINVFQRLAAIAFAVEEINNSSDILPNITLGFVMLDDCSNAKVTLLRGLQLVQNPPTSKHSAASSPSTTSLPSVPVVAVIGADSSYLTKQLASLLSVYKVPLLSYMAADPLLDNTNLYPFFNRVIPSSTHQVHATVDVLREMGWTYVSVIFSEEPHGLQSYRSFLRELNRWGYCRATRVLVRRTADKAHYQRIMNILISTPKARVVVLFLDPERYLKIFQAAFNSGLQDSFIWLLSDIVVPSKYDYIGYEAFMHGVLAVSLLSYPLPRFDERFRRMTLGEASQNPWFHEYASQYLNCSLNMSSANACNPDREIGTYKPYYRDRAVSAARDAVHAWAHALNTVTKNCTDADVRNCVEPQKLLEAFWMEEFPPEGQNIELDNRRNVMTKYEVLNFVWDNNTLVHNTVGRWDYQKSAFSFFRKDLIRWRNESLTKAAPQGDVYPESVCSKPCPIGHEQVKGVPSCCFGCQPCDDNERTVVKYSTNVISCERCPTEDNFTWPDLETRTKCLPIEAVHDLCWSRAKGIVIVIFDAMLLCGTAVTAAFFVKNSGEYLIKSTSLGMGLATLLGHGLMCVLIFSFVLYPTDVSCIASTLSIHWSFPLSYALLMVRANRIYNIRMLKSRTTTTKMFFNSVRSQAIFGIIFVVLQVLTSSLSIGLQPPWATHVMYALNERSVDQVCSIQYKNLLGPILLNILGMILCTIRAFQIRSVDVNFHEPKFIIFHIYCTAMTWLCFIPPYFLTTRLSNLLVSVVLALVLQMLSCQALLFLPKLYVIYFSPSSAHSCSATGSELSSGAEQTRFGAKTSYSGEIMPPSEAKMFSSGVITSRSEAKLPWKTE